MRTKACHESAGGPKADAMIDEKFCSRCQARFRVPGQRWCRPCLTAYARQWREQKRAATQSQPRAQDVTRATPPVATVTRPVTDPRGVGYGRDAPPGVPPGYGKPFLPREPWRRPYYCCNGCGSRRGKHSVDCTAVQEESAGGRYARYTRRGELMLSEIARQLATVTGGKRM